MRRRRRNPWHGTALIALGGAAVGAIAAYAIAKPKACTPSDAAAWFRMRLPAGTPEPVASALRDAYTQAFTDGVRCAQGERLGAV